MANIKEIREAVQNAANLQSTVKAPLKPFIRRSQSYDVPSDLPDGEYVAQVESLWNSKTDYKGSKKISPCHQLVMTVGLYDQQTNKYLGDKSVWIYGSSGDFGEAMRNAILGSLDTSFQRETPFDDIDKKSFIGKQALCTVVHKGKYLNLTGWKPYTVEDVKQVKTETTIKGTLDVWWDNLTIEQKKSVMLMVTTCKDAFSQSIKRETQAKKAETLQAEQPSERSIAEVDQVSNSGVPNDITNCDDIDGDNIKLDDLIF